MALAIDGSTPAAVTQTVNTTATVTTASFTPPAGSLLLILWQGNTGNAINPATPTITDSLGTPLTYTLLDWQSHVDSPAVNGQVASWSALVGASAAMTVTVTSGTLSGNRQAALQVIVLTGQHATPIGAHGKAGSASAATISQSYTAQATNGWGFVAACDWNALGSQTAGTGCTLISTGTIPTTQISYGNVRRTTADDSNGLSNILNVTLPGTSTNLAWVYVEVVPAAGAAGTLPIEPTIGQAQRPTRAVAGQAFVTRSISDPPPVGPVPLVVDPVAGINWPRTGSAVIIRPPSEPYLDPPGWRQAPTTPASAPRIGSALVVAPRTDVAAAPDIPPVPIVETIRTLTTPVVGTATVTRSTADPDFPPTPVVEVSRAATPPPWAPTATVTSSRVDPAAVVDFPPAPIVEMSRPNLGPPAAGNATTTRPVADPPATPTGPAPLVLVARTATAPTVAPAAVTTRPTADPVPDARPPSVIVTIGMPAETLGWAVLSRTISGPPQPTRTLTYVATPTPTPIRVGTAIAGVPRADPPPLLVGPAGFVGADSGVAFQPADSSATLITADAATGSVSFAPGEAGTTFVPADGGTELRGSG